MHKKILQGPLPIFGGAHLHRKSGLPRFKNALLRFKSGLPRFKNGLPRFKNGLLRFKSGLLRFKNGLLRFKNGLLRFKNGLLRFKSGLPRFKSELPRFKSGLPRFKSGLPRFKTAPPRFKTAPPRFKNVHLHFKSEPSWRGNTLVLAKPSPNAHVPAHRELIHTHLSVLGTRFYSKETLCACKLVSSCSSWSISVVIRGMKVRCITAPNPFITHCTRPS